MSRITFKTLTDLKSYKEWCKLKNRHCVLPGDMIKYSFGLTVIVLCLNESQCNERVQDKYSLLGVSLEYLGVYHCYIPDNSYTDSVLWVQHDN